MPCRALEAFRRSCGRKSAASPMRSLNALSGIGGVQTLSPSRVFATDESVLMPCRALEAFRPRG